CSATSSSGSSRPGRSGSSGWRRDCWKATEHVRLILEGEQRLNLQVDGAGLEVQSIEPGLSFSPLHMLAASLATCTAAVLIGWAQRTRTPCEDLSILVEWEYVEDP